MAVRLCDSCVFRGAGSLLLALLVVVVVVVAIDVVVVVVVVEPVHACTFMPSCEGGQFRCRACCHDHAHVLDNELINTVVSVRSPHDPCCFLALLSFIRDEILVRCTV